MKHILIVVDIQNDFVDGALGTAEAFAMVGNAAKKIKDFDGDIFVTFDTHYENYMETAEGSKLPVPHCIKDTDGWQICDELKPYVKNCIDKITFGSVDLPSMIDDGTDEVILCGLCTDICVISNAMILKAHYPELKITIDAACCAGVTRESHKIALDAMRAVQIEIKE